MNIKKSKHVLIVTHALESGPLVATHNGAAMRVATVQVTVHGVGSYSVSLEGPKLKKDGADSAVWVKPYISFQDLPAELKPLIEDAFRRHAIA